MVFSLITGGSMGIGKSLAEACARRGFNVALVALQTPELEQTAQEIRERYGVETRYFGVDLTQEGATKSVYEWCQQEGIQVNMLLNNAGFGGGALFKKFSLDQYQSMIKVNNLAMVELTYYFLEHLKTHPKAWLMNTSSMEATLHLPYKATYTSTKAFVYAFSLSLREELRPTSVKVSVLCPGGTITASQNTNRNMQTLGAKARYLVDTADFVAETAIRNMLKGKAVIIPNRLNWGIVQIVNLLPVTLKVRLMERIFRGYKNH